MLTHVGSMHREKKNTCAFDILQFFCRFLLSGVQATKFHFVRDYEVVKVEQGVPNELLVFDDTSTAPSTMVMVSFLLFMLPC